MSDLARCSERLHSLSPEYEARARAEYIPIIRPESLKLLLDAAKKTKCRRILEIGTAIGFSTAWLAVETGAVIDTIEKDEARLERAREFWKSIDIEDRINSYQGNADELVPALAEENKYDFVFIDAAKSRYSDYLDAVYPSLEKGGIVFADNVYYLGLVKGDAYPPHKHRTIVVNMRAFLKKISDKDKFDTTIYDTEDGTAVCVKL